MLDNRDDNPVNDNRPKTLRSALTGTFFGSRAGIAWRCDMMI
jgi:hypothetical protein